VGFRDLEPAGAEAGGSARDAFVTAPRRAEGEQKSHSTADQAADDPTRAIRGRILA
jgi:hypothetical protein